MKEIPKRRDNYYYLKEFNNEPLISVTYVLDVIAKPGLLYWYGKMVFEAIAQDPSLLDNKEKALAAPYEYRDQRADYGSKAHEIIDHEERGIRYDRKNLDPKVVAYLEARDKFIKDHPELKVIFSESIGVNKTHKYAGQIDRIVQNTKTKETFLIDWKTTKNIYYNNAWQLAAYRNFELIEDRKNKKFVKMPKIDREIVVHLKSDSTYDLYEFTGDFKVFLAAKYIILSIEKREE